MWKGGGLLSNSTERCLASRIRTYLLREKQRYCQGLKNDMFTIGNEFAIWFSESYPSQRMGFQYKPHHRLFSQLISAHVNVTVEITGVWFSLYCWLHLLLLITVHYPPSYLCTCSPVFWWWSCDEEASWIFWQTSDHRMNWCCLLPIFVFDGHLTY